MTPLEIVESDKAHLISFREWFSLNEWLYDGKPFPVEFSLDSKDEAASLRVSEFMNFDKPESHIRTLFYVKKSDLNNFRKVLTRGGMANVAEYCGSFHESALLENCFARFWRETFPNNQKIYDLTNCLITLEKHLSRLSLVEKELKNADDARNRFGK